MSLRRFADHCVPRSIIRALRDAGHDVLVLKDHLPVNSPDEHVIAKVQELGAILLSLNGDFSDIVRYPPANYLGIIALQVRNHPELIPQILQRLIAYLVAHPAPEQYAGTLLLVEAHRIRVRVRH